MTEGLEIAGWHGAELVKAGDGAISQMALVYSDIEPSIRVFSDSYPYNRTPTNEVSPGPGEPTFTHHWVVQLPLDTAATRVAVEDHSPGVKLESGLTTTGVDETTLDSLDTVRGSYAGVAGQFTCIGGAAGGTVGCTLNLDEAGVLWWYSNTTIAGEEATVLFKADDPATLLGDPDYLAFGVWALVPDSPTHGNAGQTRPFATGGAAKFSMADIAPLQGAATYEGAAAGHYATRAQGSHLVDHGRFTASVTIEARFDNLAPATEEAGPGGAGNGTYTVTASAPVTFKTGTMVHDFMDHDGNAMEGWLVNLGSPAGGGEDTFMASANRDYNSQASRDGLSLSAAELTQYNDAVANAVGAGTALLGGTSGGTGSQAWSGTWDGTFHGTNKETYPTGIAGRFEASVGGALPEKTTEARIDLFEDEGFAGVVGAFGARR